MLHSQPNGDIWKHWRATYTLQWSSHSYFYTKHPFRSWYSHFPISISSGAPWDFHTAAVSLRCPRLVASVPKLSVPLGRDAYLCCSSKIQSPHRQIRPCVDVVGCDKIPLEALAHDHYYLNCWNILFSGLDKLCLTAMYSKCYCESANLNTLLSLCPSAGFPLLLYY